MEKNIYEMTLDELKQAEQDAIQAVRESSRLNKWQTVDRLWAFADHARQRIEELERGENLQPIAVRDPSEYYLSGAGG